MPSRIRCPAMFLLAPDQQVATVGVVPTADFHGFAAVGNLACPGLAYH
nr:hypothetical protein [Thiothrix subterranea]